MLVMTPDLDADAVLFDIGDTLVHAAAPGTPVDALAVHLRPQVAEDLRALADAGLRLGAVTDTAVMTETDVRALLAPTGIDALLEVVVTSVDVGAPKPEPRSLQTALARMGVPADRTLFIGDRVVDREAARAAGTRFAFVGATIEATIAQVRSGTGGEFNEALVRWSERRHERATTAASEARRRIDALAKPPGSLGRLEELAVHLAATTAACPPPPFEPATVLVFAADHGVVAHGVSRWPQEVTAAMAATIASGRASVNALATAVGARVVAVDVGVANAVPHGPALIDRRIRPGTRNLAIEAAMTLAEVSAALDVGAASAAEAIDQGAGASPSVRWASATPPRPPP
jgi:FMN phosphatase YigB (HAD superfamily)